MISRETLDKFIEYINTSKRIVFFGGAGVSTESGIPDFRSKDGLYNQKDVDFAEYSPEYLLSQECLYHNPKVFFAFYRQKMDTRNVQPNVTHKVLAKLEECGKLSAVITQNIDGLHQKAGSKKVYEIHGTTRKNYCTKCGARYGENFIFESKDVIPRCPECGGMVRPDVVLYGENVQHEKEAVTEIYNADMLIVGGTSLQVYPANSYVDVFRGRHMAVVNREDVGVKIGKEDVFIQESLGEVFEEVLSRARTKNAPILYRYYPALH
ncbi:MAG: NAD-dependent protein deacylase [Bacillota bacterium]|nr:NAD-dependent protein deacylase [Bacillota bacterium]